MNAIDMFLSLPPRERIERILSAKNQHPQDPYPALRCVSIDPGAAFPQLEDSVNEEIRLYIQFMADLGRINSDDVEAVTENGEKYVLALAIMRVQVAASTPNT